MLWIATRLAVVVRLADYRDYLDYRCMAVAVRLADYRDYLDYRRMAVAVRLADYRDYLDYRCLAVAVRLADYRTTSFIGLSYRVPAWAGVPEICLMRRHRVRFIHFVGGSIWSKLF